MSFGQLQVRLNTALMLGETERAGIIRELMGLLRKGIHFSPEGITKPRILKESRRFIVAIYPPGWILLHGEWKHYRTRGGGYLVFEVMWKEEPSYFPILAEILTGINLAVYQGRQRVDDEDLKGRKFERVYTPGRTHVRL